MPITRSPRTLLPLLALLVALLVPAGAQARMAKGLEDDAMVLSDDGRLRASFWERARSAHVRTVRVLAKWDGHQTAVPADQVVRLRRAAVEGQAAGARLTVGVYHGIARGHSSRFRVSPHQRAAYVSFYRSLAAGLADVPVGSYLTWNEPNYKTTWPQAQARTWVKVSNATYRAIRDADPGVPILAGEAAPVIRTRYGSTNPGAFFRKALCLTAAYRSASQASSCRTRLLADGFTLHTYDFDRPPTSPSGDADEWTHGNLRSTMRQLRLLAGAGRISSAAAHNVHVSEFAYRTQGSHATPIRRATSWLRSAWRSAKAAGVRSFVWYQLRDPRGPTDWASGLLTSRGVPRSTWTAFRRLR